MHEEESSEDNFKVAPIISTEKMSSLLYTIVQTLLGFHVDEDDSFPQLFLIMWLPLFELVPALIKINLVAILIPTAALPIITLLVTLIRRKQIVWHRLIVISLYGLLWSNHIQTLVINNNWTLLALSTVTIFTSVSTVAYGGCKQFASDSPYYNVLALDSTLYARFMISLPTLIAQFIIDQSMTISTDNSHIYYLRLTTSLLFILWTLGWLTTIQGTLYFFINRINMFLLGDQSKNTLQQAVLNLLFNILSITVIEIVVYNTQNHTFIAMIVAPTITSMLSVIIMLCFTPSLSLSLSCQGKARIAISMVAQWITCIALANIAVNVDLKTVNVQIVLFVDIGLVTLFLLMDWMAQLHQVFSHWIIKNIQRFALRLISGFTVLLLILQYAPLFGTVLLLDQNLVNYIVVPFIGYRSFKRTISISTTYSLHISILICLILHLCGAGTQGALAMLMFPPLPPNFLRSLFSFNQIPPKAIHRCQTVYKIFYLFCSCIGICLYLVTLGTLQLTMIFGLPIYFPVMPSYKRVITSSIQSPQSSLYAKILSNIDCSVFRSLRQGLYLLRIDKYILLAETKNQLYGFCELMQFRGLEVQQVTSCHSKEGDTIDKMVEYTWGENKECQGRVSMLMAAISPCLRATITVPMENDIQLTGVLEDKQFVKLFKQTSLKAFIRYYSLEQTKPQSTAQAHQSATMLSQFTAIYKKDVVDKIFPFDFAMNCKLQVNYPTGKIKLRPLRANKVKKDQILTDFMDLLQQSPDRSSNQFDDTTIDLQHKDLPRRQEINMAVVLTMFYYTVGKQDYFHAEKLYHIAKMDPDAVPQIQYQGFVKLAAKALTAAFKISVEKHIVGQQNVNIEDFQDYERGTNFNNSDCFVGTSDSEQFSKAMLQDKSDIWTLNYSKKTLSVKRLARAESNLYLFYADEVIVRSVWNNLHFEMLYAANDDNERYSIQTHPTLLRNLWVEACDVPFGYPSYMSGLVINK